MRRTAGRAAAQGDRPDRRASTPEGAPEQADGRGLLRRRRAASRETNGSSDRLVRSAATVMERRVSRRGLLARVAVAGSALAVAPIRYLTRPVEARALVTCSSCRGGRCCDGWTAFCCTVNHGINACPPYSFMGGWWKCTNYTGGGACAKEGVRYYIDCNRTPTARCPHGCHCSHNRCSKRRTCCNVFRYGQCSTEIAGITEVVCRIIKCVNPCKLFVNCNCTLKIENAVCRQEEGCL